MNLHRLLLFLCLSFAVTTIYAEVYRSVDENGKVHFGDPPAGLGKEDIKVKQDHLTTQDTKSKVADAKGTVEQVQPPTKAEQLNQQAEELRAAREERQRESGESRERKERNLDCNQSQQRIKELQAEIDKFVRRKTGKTTHDKPETVRLDRENRDRAREIIQLEAIAGAKCKDR